MEYILHHTKQWALHIMLSIEIDTISMQLCLPQDKLHKLQEWQFKIVSTRHPSRHFWVT